MHPAADPALVAAARGGDRQALESLLRDHLPLVYSVVRRTIGAAPDVDDVVQETMLRAVRHVRALRDPHGFRAWLIAIAVRQLQERSRHLTRAPQPIDLTDDATTALPDPYSDFAAPIEERLDLAREMRTIARAAGFLSQPDRQVLALWSQEVAGGLSRAEVAAALALTPAHTAVRVQRMRAQLDLALTVLRALQAQPRCEGLTETAQRWNQFAEPRWLKRLGRHVRGCAQCLLAGQRGTPPELALGTAWLLPVPAYLTWQIPTVTAAKVMAAVGDGMRRVLGYFNLKTLGLAGTAAVMVLAVQTVPEPPETIVAPPPNAPTATVAPPTVGPRPAQSASAPAAPAPRLITVAAEGVSAADIYVATDGDDINPGTQAQPLATLTKAVSVVRPGQVIALRAGTHRPSSPVRITTSGTQQQRITLSNLIGERPVIDASAIPATSPMIDHSASYWTVQGIELRNAPAHGYVCRACRYNILRRLWLHDNGNTALMLRDPGTVGNQVLDSDFTRNHDTTDRGGSADGLSVKNGAGAGNLVSGNRFAENSGDGLDLSNFADAVTVTANWSYGNGHNRWQISDFNGPGNGIKLGGGEPAPAVNHLVSDNASWDNAGYGFTESGNRGRITLSNNTAYRNGATGFAFVYSQSLMRRNLALANGRDAQLGEGVDDSGNSWGDARWSTTDLRSGDPTTARGERGPSGRLPATTFLLNRKDPTMGASMTANG
ncbi:hypothetical protein Rhe02_91340 [Rhizocola hellebori]|uniref:Sigma-70 family RNA polymerase sigma factor n=1 Tax=Rhizocola hellebori TaxID=1392758 RepID=A0A8J3VLV2_9ACTN|nr:sigma-70 family RNA polymerase sigma factor [Rhizocola hellebori]GIH11067.1 hypothetical protein Rhe02_91340 [Rhizocola hellebori]